MKKTLLFAALLIGGLSQLTAQCTISPACTPDANTGYCTIPADNTALPNGTELSPYNTTIQISVGTSAAGGVITVISASLTSVSGLPNGMSYSMNPSNGFISAGTDACLLITGTPASGSANSYTINANIDAVTNAGSFPQTISWFLTIDAASTTGIKILNQNTAFSISPNPASSELTVSSSSHFGKIQIIDALGKTVITHDANYTSQTVINVSTLSKGVYFLQAVDGANLITRKFIKD
ncbi:MAG: T9SS type A sorting domain-containing protein [Bacteroidetes bacterium]|nr:T9SS type A sorting domain-containing protein [Bacteroidota bacterium]